MLDPLLQRVYDRYPEAISHYPCPCGIVCVVVSRGRPLDPALHYRIDDAELRDECVRVIRENNLPFSAVEGGDLILIEVA